MPRLAPFVSAATLVQLVVKFVASSPITSTHHPFESRLGRPTQQSGIGNKQNARGGPVGHQPDDQSAHDPDNDRTPVRINVDYTEVRVLSLMTRG
jgi:hypothetical protein